MNPSPAVHMPYKLSQATTALLENEWSADNHDIEWRTKFPPLLLSSHLAHGVVALHYLGADEEKIHGFVHDYSKRLHKPVPSGQTLQTDREVNTLIGKRDAYPSLLRYYKKQIEEHGVLSCVDRFYPRLAQGVGGVAFHGLIHLGYGLAADCTQVIAEGLAYLHHSYLPIGEIKQPQTEEEFPTGSAKLLQALTEMDTTKLDNVLQAHMGDFGFTAASVFGIGMMALSQHATKEIVRIVQQLDLRALAENPNELLDVALTVFALFDRPNDFFVLHLVTSCWALLQILPCISAEVDKLLAVHGFVAAMIAAIVVQHGEILDASVLPDWTETPASFWEDIKQKAINLKGDEHVWKVVQVALSHRENVPDGERVSDQVIKLVVQRATGMPLVGRAARLKQFLWLKCWKLIVVLLVILPVVLGVIVNSFL
eukprot:TRINITY_DN67047_c6_g8_i1.p1 TRINITY_DN67047_c6_g8~~TRINITY_DN67047_c6_g8_i1.p1  ORF type:complete len:426 (+),score=20.72 TRINITY_DN67047_c6_g8_i1:27-1304(+)